MAYISKDVLVRFLNKIPNGYEIEYNDKLSFDKLVLIYSVATPTAYLIAKRNEGEINNTITKLLKETDTIDSIKAFSIEKTRISKFNWKEATLDMANIITRFEADNTGFDSEKIQTLILNVLKKEREENLDSPFKDKSEAFTKEIAVSISRLFTMRGLRYTYHCSKKTTRLLEKIIKDIWNDYIFDTETPTLTVEELYALKNALKPYFKEITFEFVKSPSDTENEISEGEITTDDLEFKEEIKFENDKKN